MPPIKKMHWGDLNVRGPQLRALCIGNNTKGNHVFPDLKNCAKDASAVAQRVRIIFEPDAVTLECNIKTKEQLVTVLRDFLKRFDHPPRMVIIYFSGHGVQEGDEIFLVPTDAEPRTLDELRAQCLSHDDLFRILKQDMEDRQFPGEAVGDGLSCVLKSLVLGACCLK